MWRRALLLVLLIALSAHGEEYASNLKVGQSLNIFARFGFLALSMKVAPRNATWVFREPTGDVFAGVDSFAVRPKRFTRKSVFQGEYHMEFAENFEQLLQAYFRDFTVEKLNKPWKAFTASWVPELASRQMGINASFTQKNYAYVLVRLSRFRDHVMLSGIPNNVELDEGVAEEVNNVTVGDTGSVMAFIEKFGSHYINSYTTGNSLYQVFVYQRQMFLKIRERLKTRGIAEIDHRELGNFFSPWYAEHTGIIKTASGNKTVDDWAAENLLVNSYVFTYPSLLKLNGDLKLLRVMNENLKNEAILKMDMRAISPAFKDPSKREWFEDVLDNFLKLWESNL